MAAFRSSFIELVTVIVLKAANPNQKCFMPWGPQAFRLCCWSLTTPQPRIKTKTYSRSYLNGLLIEHPVLSLFLLQYMQFIMLHFSACIIQMIKMVAVQHLLKLPGLSTFTMTSKPFFVPSQHQLHMWSTAQTNYTYVERSRQVFQQSYDPSPQSGASRCDPVTLPLFFKTVFSSQIGKCSEKQLLRKEKWTWRNTLHPYWAASENVSMMSPITNIITIFSSPKPWQNAEVRALLKASDAIFREHEVSALGQQNENLLRASGGLNVAVLRKRSEFRWTS